MKLKLVEKAQPLQERTITTELVDNKGDRHSVEVDIGPMLSFIEDFVNNEVA